MAASSTSERRTTVLKDEIVALEDQLKDEPNKAVGKLADLYLKDGRPKDAIRILERFNEGDNVERHVLLAQARFDAFDNEGARSAISEVNKNGTLSKNARAQLLLGELAFESEKFDDAKDHLRKAYELDPKNRRAAELLTNLGEPVSVPEDSEEGPVGFRTDDEDAEPAGRAIKHVALGALILGVLLGGYYWYAQRSYAAKQLVKEAAPMAENADVTALRNAEKKYKEALEIQSGNERAISGLAEIYAMLWVDHGVTSEQVRAQDWAQNSAQDDIETAERFVAEGLVAIGQDDPQRAVSIADSVFQRGGVSEKLYWVRGLGKRALGQFKEGRDDLRRAQDMRAALAHYSTALGDAYDEDGDTRNASFFWGKAAKDNPGYVTGFARGIVARARKGEPAKVLLGELQRFDAAGENIDEMGAKNAAAVALSKSFIAYRDGQFDQALAQASQAIEHAGEYPRALHARGLAYLASKAKGSDKAGIESLKLATEKSKGAAKYLFAYANALTGSGKAKDALAVLAGHKTTHEKNHRFHVALGETQLAAGDLKAATKSFDEALTLTKDYPEALLGRGMVDWHAKKYDEATKWFEKALNTRSNFPRLYEAVGRMWVEQGAASQGNPQIEMAEKQFLANGTDAVRMNAFYSRVIDTFKRARGGSSYARKWASQQDAYQKALAANAG